jgi:pilus assembly protein TadC
MATDLQKIEQSGSLDPKTADQLAILEQRIEQIRDSRDEERFFFILVIVILMDFIAIIATHSFLVLIPFLLELPALAWLAKRFGVEEFAIWIERTAAAIEKMIPGKKDG